MKQMAHDPAEQNNLMEDGVEKHANGKYGLVTCLFAGIGIHAFQNPRK